MEKLLERKENTFCFIQIGQLIAEQLLSVRQMKAQHCFHLAAGEATTTGS
jgi:hypothetical protein